MKAKKIIGRLLLGFVLISVGFAIGKKTAPSGAQSAAVAPSEDKVVVYYMHRSVRCMTCNLVETMGEELIRTEFGEAVASGRLEWKPANYEEDAQLAGRYDVGGNIILAVRFRDGKEVARARLDRVMELAYKRDEFMSYVREGVRSVLEETP